MDGRRRRSYTEGDLVHYCTVGEILDSGLKSERLVSLSLPLRLYLSIFLLTPPCQAL